MIMTGSITERQREILKSIRDGSVPEDPPTGYRISARALANRRLVAIHGHGDEWYVELTDAGKHYLETGDYPEGHFGPTKHHDARRVAAAATKTRKPRGRSQQLAREELPIDSPSGARRRGGRPRGDELFRDSDPDPHDERILITVKEAAWRLSLTENAIREAVRSGDLQRVFIGQGNTNYRIVYGSLLAWVNDMPQEPARSWWF
ncbi:MAG TPA: excisionase [Dermacoccus sp.]|nr:excisionase [Dermacoccus sp.]